MEISDKKLICQACSYIPAFHDRFADLEKHCVEHHGLDLIYHYKKESLYIKLIKWVFSKLEKYEV